MTPDPSGRHDPPDLPWLGEAAVPEVLAVIWATVDLERTLGPHRDTIDDDPLLGGRVVVLPAGAGRPPLAVAEPTTEGRLAARLARSDEGPAGWYLRPPLPAVEVRRRAAAAGIALGPVADGPFGAAAVVLGGPLGGPILILVDGAAVPSRP